MPGYDFSQVAGVYDKASYAPGQLMTVTLRGNATRTDDAATETVSVSLQLVTESGGKGSLDAVPVAVTYPGSSGTEAVFIDGTAFTAAGRTWTVSADRKSATATA